MVFPANIISLTDSQNYELSNNGDIDIHDDLNENQLDAVTYIGGPLLVVAGAGSGKTRVLTRRIAYLISKEMVSPFEILAITFTNKAAKEMLARVSNLVGPVASRMWVSTFHSACARLLRIDGTPVGVASGFSIYDVSDATRLVDYARRDLGADPKRFNAKTLHRQISAWKNEMITPTMALENADMESQRTTAQIYGEYNNRLRSANAVDFDDLLIKTVELLNDNDDIRDKYNHRFSHILVDEFQDTNMAQWELVRLLSGEKRNITVVGDADQSIYKFRGADHRNMERFEQEYKDAHVVVLNTNYRSTENILNAANSVISNNKTRYKKELVSNKGSGEAINVFYANSDKNEAKFVIEKIQERMQSDSLNSIAIFYRTNAQSRLLEEYLIRSGIAYRIIGGTRFFDRKEIRDAISYLRVFVNPADEASWRRIINEPKRGIGESSIQKITAYSRMYDLNFRQALDKVDSIGLSKRALSAVRSLCSVYDVVSNGEYINVADVLDQILHSSGYIKSLDDEGSFESQGRLENLIELVNQAREFDSTIEVQWKEQVQDEPLRDTTSPFDRMSGFLEAVSLLADSDRATSDDDAVTLMTLHSAKGLEYPTVFITGLEEGLFPHERSMGDISDLEEERRLCYVGITRAMSRLYLSCALSRSTYATPDFYSPSRFLKEIPAELVKAQQDRDASDFQYKSQRPGSSQQRTSRYSQVHNDIVFDDIDPDDEFATSTIIGRTKKSRDTFASKQMHARIWGDSKPDDDNTDDNVQTEPSKAVAITFNIDSYPVGTSVYHDKYGLGTVVKVDTHRNGDSAISVSFPADRTRIFMASLNPPISLA